MGTDTLRTWAGVGLVVLLAVAPLRAQTPPLPNKPAPLVPAADTKPPATLPDTLPIATPIDAPTLPMPCPLPPDAPEHGLLSGLSFDAEYLLLQPRRNALDFAVVSPNTQELPSGVIDSLNYETRSAFRFGAGYDLSAQGWCIGVYYTYLHSADSSMVNAPDGGALYATLTRAGTYDQVSSAFAAASLNYNVIDVEASKHLLLNESLGLNVFGGVRVAWIDQTFGAIYNGGSFGATNVTADSPVYFHGAGLTLGADAEWKIYRGFGLYGLARGSLLSGQFRNFFIETNNGGQTPIVNVSETYNQIVPVLELGAGVSWQTEHVRLRVGYDLANWFNMVNSPDFSSPADIGKLERRTSDLTLEGLTAQVEFVF